MKTAIKFFLLLIPFFSHSQISTVDSLKQLLQKEKNDTSRVLLLNQLSRIYLNFRPDTAMLFARQGLSLAKQTGFTEGEAGSLNRIANVFSITGNYPKALQLHLEAENKAEAAGDEELVIKILGNIGIDFALHGDDRQAINYIKKALGLAEKMQAQSAVLNALINLGADYEKINVLDSALIYIDKAYDLAVRLKDDDNTGIALDNRGNIYAKMGEDVKAMTNYRLAIPYLTAQGNNDALCESYLGIAKLFLKTGNADSSLYYAKKSLALSQVANLTDHLIDVSDFLTNYYVTKHNMDSAFFYQSATIAAKDSFFSQEKQREVQNLTYDEMLRQQQIQEAKEAAKTQLKFNLLFAGLFTLFVVAFFLYRNIRHKQKANALLQQQKEKVESNLQQLKLTQAQLVQSEKMASLGELTAGIAHEIQNPLNFVNNFSEINTELVEEFKEALKAGNTEQAVSLADDIIENQEKINHHGKRADAIVKGMLQHSRQTKGIKESTDVNALCDEYLRLSYHGLRAKDKLFNADFRTEFDDRIGKINIVPQDIGRVLLNLFNNAFYATSEKNKSADKNYKPVVSVQTKKLNDKIEIVVSDNGNGISQRVLDKIFQPFFTTKPTGQGTGLGLSLSYDIIKAHEGEIKVETKEGEGSEFLIQLPNENAG